MLRLLALTALGAAIVVPAFAQQAPAPTPAPAAAQGAPGAGGAPGAPGGEAGRGRGGGGGRGGGPGGQGFPGGGRGGRGPGGEGQPAAPAGPPLVANPQLQTTPLEPVTVVLATQAIPKGPLLPGTIIPAPPGFFSGMNLTDGAGILFARVLSEEGGVVLIQTIDGRKHLVSTADLKIDHSTAVTKLSEAQLRALPGPNTKPAKG